MSHTVFSPTSVEKATQATGTTCVWSMVMISFYISLVLSYLVHRYQFTTQLCSAVGQIQGASPQIMLSTQFWRSGESCKEKEWNSTYWMVKPLVFDGKSTAICNETGDGLFIWISHWCKSLLFGRLIWRSLPIRSLSQRQLIQKRPKCSSIAGFWGSSLYTYGNIATGRPGRPIAGGHDQGYARPSHTIEDLSMVKDIQEQSYSCPYEMHVVLV